MRKPKSYQIELPEKEKLLLANRIETDIREAQDSHRDWSRRCAGWMQKWEARVERPKAQDKGKPNHTVPLLQWQSFAKIARDVQAIFGDNAEITASATGPSDASAVHKIGRYETSRVFDQMDILIPFIIFEFRRVLNGWSAAYRPWWRRTFQSLDRKGNEVTVCDYEGPGFFPLEPDDLMVPGERGVTSLQEFSFVCHRERVTVDELQRGEGTLYQGTRDPGFVERALRYAQDGVSNDWTMNDRDQVRTERERSEGVDYDSYLTSARTLWVWNWYGKWRPLLKNKSDGATQDDIQKRSTFESDWVVRYIPGMNEIVGCQDLLRLYPKMRRRRPFVESTLLKDGSYRPKGFGALLEDLEDEATANSRLFTAAGELSVWPIVFFKPSGGMAPKTIQLTPGLGIPTENPKDIYVVNLTPNLSYGAERQQDIFATAERITGITDQALGRASDRPNAPRTASGQISLIEEGNIRASLDSTIFKADMEVIIGDFWALDCDLAPKTQPGLFFRVTEEQANGLFDTKQGGAYMTPKEFAGTYDFKLKFATSIYARAAQKQEFMAFYTAAMASPLVQQNPAAMWALLNMLAKKFDIDFESIVPKPPQLDQAKTPEAEWTLMLEGQTVEVNPADHDDLHLQKHYQQGDDERKNPDRDEGAIQLLVKHIADHQQQKRTKMLMQAMTAQVMQQLQPPGQMGSELGDRLLNTAEMYQQPGGEGEPQGEGGEPQQGPPEQQQGPPPGGMPPEGPM